MSSYDQVIPFQLQKLPIRGRIVILDKTINVILGKHDYPSLVGSVLAEAITFGTLMATSLKFEGIFTFQTKTDGPLHLIVADVTQKGIIRGYAQFDEEKVEAFTKEKDLPSLPRLLGKGQVALTLDQGAEMERYQGLVALEGNTLAESLQHYFNQSEQLKTSVFLAAEKKDGLWRAGGLFLQLMPEIDQTNEEKNKEDWHLAMMLLSTLKKQELLSPKLTPQDILFRLFHEQEVGVFEPLSLEAGCRCSRKRIYHILENMTEEDRIGLLENELITVTCQFCNSHYQFTLEEFEKKQ